MAANEVREHLYSNEVAFVDRGLRWMWLRVCCLGAGLPTKYGVERLQRRREQKRCMGKWPEAIQNQYYSAFGANEVR